MSVSIVGTVAGWTTFILVLSLGPSFGLRRASAELKHLLLTAALLSLIILPLAQAFSPKFLVPVLPSRAQSLPSAEALPQQADDHVAAHTRTLGRVGTAQIPSDVDQRKLSGTIETNQTLSFPVAIVLLWALGALATAAYMIVGRWRLRSIRSRAEHLKSISWTTILGEERALAHVNRDVLLLQSSATTSPVTWGFHRPIILLPDDAPTWPIARRRIVLRHELAHIIRGDAISQLIASTACAMHWYHPLVWLAAYRLQVECELACDDRVLASGTAAVDYAEHLISIARRAYVLGSMRFLSLPMAGMSPLSARIRAILDDKARGKSMSVGQRISTGCVICVLMIAISACKPVAGGSEAPVPGIVTVQEGVRTVHHSADAFVRAPQLTLEELPLTVMRGRLHDPASDLDHVSHVLEIPDGQYAVMRYIDPRVFVFGADGARLRTFGTPVNGPNDFVRPVGMVRLGGDTLYVPDPGNHRAFWIHAREGVIRTSPLSLQHDFYSVRGLLADRRILLKVDIQGPLMQNIALSRSDDGSLSVIDSLAAPKVKSFATHYRGRAGSQSLTFRFGPRPDVAAWDTLVAVAPAASSYMLEQHGPEGQLVSRIHVARNRRPVTQAMREAQIASQLRKIDDPIRFERPVDIDESRRIIREAPFADSLAPYSSIFTSPSKLLWVVDVVAPGDSSWSATAFRGDGAIVGRLRSTHRGMPLYFGDDRVILRIEDATRNVSLQVFRIIPGLGG